MKLLLIGVALICSGLFLGFLTGRQYYGIAGNSYFDNSKAMLRSSSEVAPKMLWEGGDLTQIDGYAEKARVDDVESIAILSAMKLEGTVVGILRKKHNISLIPTGPVERIDLSVFKTDEEMMIALTGEQEAKYWDLTRSFVIQLAINNPKILAHLSSSPGAKRIKSDLLEAVFLGLKDQAGREAFLKIFAGEPMLAFYVLDKSDSLENSRYQAMIEFAKTIDNKFLQTPLIARSIYQAAQYETPDKLILLLKEYIVGDGPYRLHGAFYASCAKSVFIALAKQDLQLAQTYAEQLDDPKVKDTAFSVIKRYGSN